MKRECEPRATSDGWTRRPARRALATVLLAAAGGAAGLAAGCGDGTRAEPETTVRDSADVRIVETVPEVWPPLEVWRVSEEPELQIGVREGDPDHELHQVRGALGFPDGSVVVAEFEARLRYYGVSGEHLGTFDRRGNGPGEAPAFADLSRYRGDSLLVTAGRAMGFESVARFVVLSPDGSYGRDLTATYPGRGPPSDGETWLFPAGQDGPTPLGDGSFVAASTVKIDLRGSPGDMLRGQMALMRLDPEGRLVDTVAVVPEGLWEYRPMSQRGFELVAGTGDWIPLRTRGSRLYRASWEHVRVDLYEAAPLEAAEGARPPGEAGAAPSARLTQSYRVLAPRHSYGPAEREVYARGLIDVYEHDGTDDSRADYRRRIESLRTPEWVPAIQDLRVDPPGNLWLELYEPPGARTRAFARRQSIPIETGPSRWVVLDPGGRLLGSVRMPDGLEVLVIGGDHVLGLWRDELGVEHVRRHAIVK